MPTHLGQRAALRPISFSVPPEVRGEVEAAALAENRNLSNWVRAVVMRELACRREAAAATAAPAGDKREPAP